MAMQSTTDMADSSVAIAALALSTIDTLTKTAAPVIEKGGLQGKALQRLTAVISALPGCRPVPNGQAYRCAAG